MAPARIDEDPITAEYDVYLTPEIQEQIFLLQYPNRSRNLPYNERFGVLPQEMRIKPQTGHLELDVDISTEHNFNKYQGLKWGDAMRTAREIQNESATFGQASGFSGAKVSNARRAALRDEFERETKLQNDLTTFYDAERQEKVMHTQTLGGQIINHDSIEEAGKPLYFVGAFRGSELHLSKVAGTVQMRPQFHYVDAEDQRKRLAPAGAGGAADGGEGPSRKQPEQARLVQQTYRNSANPKGELEIREHQMREMLHAATEEPWTKLEYLEEDDPTAYSVWDQTMFVKDPETSAPLKSSMSNDDYLDAISAPGRESPTRRRKRTPRKKDVVDLEDPDGEDGVVEGAG